MLESFTVLPWPQVLCRLGQNSCGHERSMPTNHAGRLRYKEYQQCKNLVPVRHYLEKSLLRYNLLEQIVHNTTLIVSCRTKAVVLPVAMLHLRAGLSSTRLGVRRSSRLPFWRQRKNVTIVASSYRPPVTKEDRFVLSGRPTTAYQSLSTKNEKHNDETEQAREELLFERGRENFFLMRSGLGFSCFNTAYWLWYTAEFIPLVNASPIENLHINPALGWAGIAFGLSVQTIFFMYPKRLISRLTYRPAGFGSDGMAVPAHLSIYTHQLPLIQPATRPTVVVSSSSAESTLLDPLSNSASVLVGKHKGNIQDYKGILVIRNPNKMKFPWRPPLVLDFRDDSRVPHPHRLVQALLYPQDLWRHHDEYDTEEDDSEHHHQYKRMSRQARKNESRLRKIARKRRKRR